MPLNNTPSIYPYLAASFIEVSKGWGTIEAIRFIAQESLRELKNSHKKALELQKIIAECEKRETHVFSLLRNLDIPSGNLTYTLDRATKKIMYPLLEDFSYLYEHRMGKNEAEKLRKIFSSNSDEPYDFVLEYEMDDEHMRYRIKSIRLVSHKIHRDIDEWGGKINKGGNSFA